MTQTRTKTVALNERADQILQADAPAGVRLAALARLAHPELTQKELAERARLCVSNIERGDRLLRALGQAEKTSCADGLNPAVQRGYPVSDPAVQQGYGRASLNRSLKILTETLSLPARGPAPPAPPGDRSAAPLASRASLQGDESGSDFASRKDLRLTTSAPEPTRGETDGSEGECTTAEEADKKQEHAACRVFDFWRRAEGRSVSERPSRDVLAMIRDRLDEFDEHDLYDAIDGARFATYFREDRDRRVPELLFRDARNVRQCADAKPKRKAVPAAAPPGARENAPAIDASDLAGARSVLAKLGT